jgi:hypothetical protein
MFGVLDEALPIFFRRKIKIGSPVPIVMRFIAFDRLFLIEITDWVVASQGTVVVAKNGARLEAGAGAGNCQ